MPKEEPSKPLIVEKPRENQQLLLEKLGELLKEFGLNNLPEINGGINDAELGISLGKYQDAVREQLTKNAPTDAAASMAATALAYLKLNRPELAKKEFEELINLLVNLRLESEPMFLLVEELIQSIKKETSIEK